MLTSLLLSSVLVLAANAQLDPVPEATLQKVVDHAYASNKLSWENGTLARALTDLYWADSLSVFSPNSVPPPVSNSTINSIPPLLTLAQAVIDQKQDAFGADVFSNGGLLANGKSQNSLSLLDDGSAADPASLGELIAWANWTQQVGSEHWEDALEQEINYITSVIPRTDDGAISHRREQVQLWSDFMYMLPPFMAYYAAMTNNETMMRDAYSQCQLYRKYLYDDDVQLYKHIQLGSGVSDAGHWSTGNGWVAAGMIRIYAIIQHSSLASSFQSELSNLNTWINEIMSGTFHHQMTSGLIRDYADDYSSFADASSTALLASTAYRLSAMGLSDDWVPYAERAYKNMTSYLASEAGSDGWIDPVVDPLSWGNRGSKSPEGQSFFMLMEASRRAWIGNGAKNATGMAGKGDDKNPGKSASFRTTAHFGLAGLVGLVGVLGASLLTL